MAVGNNGERPCNLIADVSIVKQSKDKDLGKHLAKTENKYMLNNNRR